MESKMELSLEDIIKQTKPKRGRGGGSARGGRGSSRGGLRRSIGGGGGGRGARGGQQRALGLRSSGRGNFGRSRGGGGGRADDGVWQHDKFDGFGKKGRAVGGGGSGGGGGSSKITISNLHYGVSDADIMELFGEMGPIKFASVHYDRSGRSLGKADVVFERRISAEKSINQYNGVPLDGRPMVIQWAVPATATASPVGGGGGGGVAGKALRQIQGGRIGRRGGSTGKPGGTRGRGRGGGGGAGRGGGGGGRTKPPTAAELDAELDAYISQKN